VDKPFTWVLKDFNDEKYISILLMAIGLKSYSQVNPTRIQVPSYQFQNFIYDARSAGLGEGGIALSPDGNSAYLNPAKFSFYGIEQIVPINHWV
jgi:hypothetical protein